MKEPAGMDIYEQIVQLRREGRRGAIATITNVRGSIPSFQTAKMLVRDDGSIAGHHRRRLRRSRGLAGGARGDGRREAALADLQPE